MAVDFRQALESSNVRTPCCLVAVDIVKSNCQAMIERTELLGVKLRPHVKTHKTIEGGLLQTGGRKGGIVVSTLAEAAYFADAGFDDILYGVLLSPNKINDVKALHERLESFHVLIDNSSILECLNTHPTKTPWSVWLKVDCGYHRAGVDPLLDSSVDLALKIHMGSNTRLKGIYTHGGDSYHKHSRRKCPTCF